jgi:hypothetical protein
MGKALNVAGNVTGINSAKSLMKGDLKGAFTSAADPTGLGQKGLKALGINLDGEQGEYVDPAKEQSYLFNKFAGDYDNQMKLAEKGVQESALTKNLFGQGGLNDRLAGEEQKLASTGFQLQPEDHEAYGQVAGNVSRLFGQQEQNAAQSLARRGLASAGSGAAGATFSGLAGNKNEMLAAAQTQIAQKRMADNMQRLQQTRSLMSSLGNQGAQLSRQRYDDKRGVLLDSVNVERGINDTNRQAMQDKQDAWKPGLLETIGTGLQAGIGKMATEAPGYAVGGMTGGKFGTMNNYQQAEMYQARNPRRG